LRTDVLLMTANKGVGFVCAIAITVMTARQLGIAGRGAVAVALGISLLLIQVGSLGMTSANPYQVSKDPATLDRVIANSLWLAMSFGILLIAGGIVVRLVTPSVYNGLDWGETLIVLAGLPAGLAQLYLQSVLLGLGRTVALNVVDAAIAVAGAVAMAVGFYVVGMHVRGAVILISGSFVAGAAIYTTLLLRYRPPVRRPDLGLARSMLAYATRIYVATLLSFMVIRLDLLIVNSYLGTEQAGLYATAAALAQQMFIIPAVIGTNLFPRVARGGGTAASVHVFRCMAVLYGLLCLVTVPLVGPAIDLLYGSRFAPAANLYYWLVPGIFSLGMLTLISNHFAGRGFPLQAMLVWFVGLAVNVALNLSLLKAHGVVVASIASSLAYGLLLVLHIRLFAADAGGYRVLVPSFSETWAFVRTAVSRSV
jgi:O-antigen/teichoic acid export membrane protein